MNLSFDEGISVLQARVIHAAALPDFLDIATDTRSIRPGQTFLALHGDHFDGHDFVAQAVTAGAVAVIVERSESLPKFCAGIIVADTLRAYLALGAASRSHFTGPVIGITGSAGKTTTKNFLTQLLRNVYGERVLASPANENNEIGVSKVLLQLDSRDYDVAVIEMGARHPGDIGTLVQAALPTVGILTNIGDAHLEIFGTRDAIADTKWGLFSQGSRAVLNALDHESKLRARTLDHLPLWFAAEKTVLDIADSGDAVVIVGDEALHVRREGKWQDHKIRLNIPGQHQRADLAAALAAAWDMGLDLELLIEATHNITLSPGRYESMQFAGLPRIIYDAYNANPSSMRSALDAFAHEAGRTRIAVLSSMAELGGESERMHEEIGAYAATRVDTLFVGGEFAHALERGARNAGLSSEQIAMFSSNDAAAVLVRNRATPADVILLKGSRCYKLEEIIERLQS